MTVHTLTRTMYRHSSITRLQRMNAPPTMFRWINWENNLSHGCCNRKRGCWPVDGGLLRVDGLCVAVVQAVGAVIVGLCGDLPQLHAIHDSRHSGAQRDKRRFFRISGFKVAEMSFFLNLGWTLLPVKKTWEWKEETLEEGSSGFDDVCSELQH